MRFAREGIPLRWCQTDIMLALEPSLRLHQRDARMRTDVSRFELLFVRELARWTTALRIDHCIFRQPASDQSLVNIGDITL